MLLTPQGRRLEQQVVEQLSRHERLILLCGRYEGFDQRVIDILQPDEISIGDFVLNGGEVAAMVLIDAVIRLVPGVLGDECSSIDDSFSSGNRLLECAQYTRPREFRGWQVPDILLSGDHGAIARWRAEQSYERTRQRRADLLDRQLPYRTKHPRTPVRRTETRPADPDLAAPTRPHLFARNTAMSEKLIQQVEQDYLKAEVPQFEIGDTVDVHTKILEGDKERTQIFTRHGDRAQRQRGAGNVHRAAHRGRRRCGAEVPAALARASPRSK